MARRGSAGAQHGRHGPGLIGLLTDRGQAVATTFELLPVAVEFAPLLWLEPDAVEPAPGQRTTVE